MPDFIARVAADYSSLKEQIAAAMGATEELLHVHFGLLIFVVVAVVLRRRMHSLWPVLTVWAFAILNELIDYFDGNWPPLASLFDVINTVFWPMILFLVARRRRAHPEREQEAISEDGPETP